MADNSIPPKESSELMKYAHIGLMSDIGKKVQTLETMAENNEARPALEKELKELFVKVYDTFPEHAAVLIPRRYFAEHMSEYRQDDRAEIGIVSPPGAINQVVLKIKKSQSGLKPDEVHRINVKDCEFFSKDEHKSFRLAKTYDPFKRINPYVEIADRFSNSKEKTKEFIQVQKYVQGINLHELFNALTKIDLNKSRKRAIAKILHKCIDDIFYWHKHAPKDSRLNAENIINNYLANLDSAIINAKTFTDCRLDVPDELTIIKKDGDIIKTLFPKEDYTRILDSTLSNIILETDAAKISEKTIDDVLGNFDESKIVHADYRERYGHIAEDMANIMHSRVLSNFKFDKKQIFAAGNSKLFQEVLGKRYAVSQELHELFALIRAVRLRDFYLSKYAKRAYETREIREDFKYMLENYKKDIKYFDRRALEHTDNLMRIYETKNKDAYNVFNRIKTNIELMSDFSKFKFNGDSK